MTATPKACHTIPPQERSTVTVAPEIVVALLIKRPAKEFGAITSLVIAPIGRPGDHFRDSPTKSCISERDSEVAL
jgi:hypothetical protein